MSDAITSTSVLAMAEMCMSLSSKAFYTAMLFLGRGHSATWTTKLASWNIVEKRSISWVPAFRRISNLSRDFTTVSPDKAKGGLPRFFTENIQQGLTIQIQGDEFWHMSKVLRLSVDDRLELFDGKGHIVEGMVVRVGRSSMDILPVGDVLYIPPTGPFWHVAAAYGSLKGGRADWLVEKCTELGAASVMPILTRRSPVASEGRSERWNRVVLAATKQCQRLHSMDVRSPKRIDSFISEVIQASKFNTIFMADAYATPLAEAFLGIENNGNGLLLIGPEGDFTEEEKEGLVKAGAIPIGLGPRRLRVETAAIAMLSAVMIMGDSQFTSSTAVA